MKLFTLLLTFASFSVQAAPSSMKLASPISIKKVSKNLVLEFQLPCKNSTALDTARLVMSSDDTGDMAACIGLVYSSSDRECGKSNTLKTFKMTINPADYGYPTNEVDSYQAMDVAN